jgi:hypothetical protein
MIRQIFVALTMANPAADATANLSTVWKWLAHTNLAIHLS